MDPKKSGEEPTKEDIDIDIDILPSPVDEQSPTAEHPELAKWKEEAAIKWENLAKSLETMETIDDLCRILEEGQDDVLSKEIIKIRNSVDKLVGKKWKSEASFQEALDVNLPQKSHKLQETFDIIQDESVRQKVVSKTLELIRHEALTNREKYNG